LKAGWELYVLDFLLKASYSLNYWLGHTVYGLDKKAKVCLLDGWMMDA